MVRYRVQSRPPKYPYAEWRAREVFVVLDLGAGQERARWALEGDRELAETIREVLRASCGTGGRLLQESATAADLACAMADAPMRPYEPELLGQSADSPLDPVS